MRAIQKTTKYNMNIRKPSFWIFLIVFRERFRKKREDI